VNTNPAAFVVYASRPQHDHNIYTHSGDNVLHQFFAQVKQEQAEINTILSTNLPMDPLTDEEVEMHRLRKKKLIEKQSRKK